MFRDKINLRLQKYGVLSNPLEPPPLHTGLLFTYRTSRNFQAHSLLCINFLCLVDFIASLTIYSSKSCYSIAIDSPFMKSTIEK